MAARRKLSGIALTLFMMMGILAGPAGASEVDLGSPATMSELLDSPEYRAWHGDVLRLYQAFFNRDPDVGGSIYWIDKYEDGSTLDDIAWGFSNSTEFQNQYGSTLANSEFLTIVYSNVLGRAPDQEGFNYWLGQMNGGLTQHGVVRWVVANQELIANYPFAGTATPLEHILLSADQVVGFDGLVLVADFGTGPRANIELANCDATRAMPKNTMAVGYGINNEATLYEFSYEFSTVAAARSFMDQSRTIANACDEVPFGHGTLEVNVVPAPTFGDESIAIYYVNYGLPTIGHWKEVRIRIGRLVLNVGVSVGLLGSPDSVLDYAAAAVAHADSIAG